jgi:serine/threonine protein phosphatase PrpC
MCSIFSIFTRITRLFSASAQKFKDTVKAHLAGGVSEKSAVQDSLRSAYLEIDAEMRQQAEREAPDDQSGCTAISGLVTPEYVCVANAGDCRSIVMVDGVTVPMSYDHKPYNPVETARIEKAGGCVSMKRVNGDLAVSRAFGDYGFKMRTEMKAEEQQVCAEPDFKFVNRSDGNIEFLLICCDGIWDVMSNDEAGEFVKSQIKAGYTGMQVSNICSNLIEACLKKGSRDNMSVCLVIFKEMSALREEWQNEPPQVVYDQEEMNKTQRL